MPYRITDVRTERNGFRVYRMQDTSSPSRSGLDAVLSIAPHNTQSFALESVIAINSVIVIVDDSPTTEDTGLPDWLERRVAAEQRRNREDVW
jgi:hypothetical protein